MELEDWLDKKNREYRESKVDPVKRPLQAITDYAKEFNVTILLSSDLVVDIFAWFEGKSKRKPQKVIAHHDSVHYIDADDSDL